MTVMNQIDLKTRDSYYQRALDADYAIGICLVLLAGPVVAFIFLISMSTQLSEPNMKAKF